MVHVLSLFPTGPTTTTLGTVQGLTVLYVNTPSFNPRHNERRSCKREKVRWIYYYWRGPSPKDNSLAAVYWYLVKSLLMLRAIIPRQNVYKIKYIARVISKNHRHVARVASKSNPLARRNKRLVVCCCLSH